MKTRTTRIAALTPIVLAVLFATTPAGQQPAPADQAQPPVTFKAEVNYVEVDAVVVDDQGNFVRDLTKDDFQVFEDGRRQAIEIFSLVDIPVERAEQPLFAERPIEPDVQSNAGGFQGRLYVIVLDDLHTAPERTELARRTARLFVERHFGANDLAAVVHTSGRVSGAQDFTGNRRLLLDSIGEFLGRKLRSPTLERLDTTPGTTDLRDPGGFPKDMRDAERGHDARLALGALQRMAESLGGVHGRRKTLVYISEGFDYDIYDPIGTRYASSLVQDVRALIGAATRANVNIYAVDPRGVTNLGDELVQIDGFPNNPNFLLGMPSMLNEIRMSQDSLRSLSEETGGFAAVNNNDFDLAFERIVRENSSYYVLGYYPPSDKRDGRLHRIEVKVTRPNLEVRARKGYLAPRGKAPERKSAAPLAELHELFDSPIPTGGLDLNAFVAPFRGVQPNATLALAVEARGSDLAFAEGGGVFRNVLDLSIAAIDATGEIRGSEDSTLTLELKPETHQLVQQGGFRMLARVDVPPGRYQVRVAAREKGAGRSGSVFYDLEVPDFAASPLTMSGIVVASVAAARVPTARTDQLKDLIPTVPSARREFDRADEAVVYAEVYDNDVERAHVVDITATVIADDGREVFRSREERSSSELGGKPGGYGFAARIPLADMHPGLYVLRVEAASRLDGGTTVNRQIPFRVRS